MDRDELLGTLKDGVNLAGKVAVRGVGEVAKAVKSAAPQKAATADTGLYFQRHLVPRFGNFLPALEYQEVQAESKFVLGLLKNITIPAAERIFLQGCQSLLVGAVAEARDKFQEAVLKDTQFTDAYFLAGCLSLSLTDWNRAADAFQKALLCQTNLGSRVRKYLGSMRMSLCLTDNSTLAFYPDLVGLNMLSVFSLRCQGRVDEGIRLLDQLQGVMPAHPLILFMLACLYYEAAQYGKVVEHTLALQPDTSLHVAGLILQARASLALRDPQPVLDTLKRLLTRTDLDPQVLWDVRAVLASAYQAVGSTVEADRETAWLRARAPQHKDILERLGLVAGSVSLTPPPALEPPKLAGTTPTTPVPATAFPPPKPAAAATTLMPAEPPAASPETPATRPWEGRLVSEDGKIDVALTGRTLAIGREAGDLQLPWDTSASMHHATICWEQNAYWVEDLGSTNGTFVNGHRVGRRVDINRGDVVTVGNTRIKVV